MNDQYYYLVHDGRLGMKWGVRNGPPYPLGAKVVAGMKKAANTAKTAASKAVSPIKAKHEHSKTVKNDTALTKKNPKKLTNEELKKALERLDMEKRFKDMKNNVSPDRHARAKKVVADALAKGAGILSEKAFTAWADKLFNQKVSKDIRDDPRFEEFKSMPKDELADLEERVRSVRYILLNEGGGSKKAKHDGMQNDDHLAHEGIPGMKWGKRNGPPYPLDRKTAAAVKRGDNPADNKEKAGRSDSSDNPPKKLSRKQQHQAELDEVRAIINRVTRDHAVSAEDNKRFAELCRSIGRREQKRRLPWEIPYVGIGPVIRALSRVVL